MKMYWNEIIKKYPSEWVMLVNYEFDKGINPSTGEVVVHHRSRKEFGELMKNIQVEDAAIRYTGSRFRWKSYIMQDKKIEIDYIGIDCLIGNDILEKFFVKINYKEKYLFLED